MCLMCILISLRSPKSLLMIVVLTHLYKYIDYHFVGVKKGTLSLWTAKLYYMEQ